MNNLGKFRALALIAVAVAGLLGGHSLTYLRLAPAPGSRHALLEATGHGYLDRALVLAGALTIMVTLYWLVTGALGSRFSRPSLMRTAVSLAAIQSTGFVVQEVLERLMAGAPLQGLGTVLLVGIPLQLAVAAFAAALVTALHRVGEKVGALLARWGPSKAGESAQTLILTLHFSSSALPGSLRSRGPPLAC